MKVRKLIHATNLRVRTHPSDSQLHNKAILFEEAQGVLLIFRRCIMGYSRDTGKIGHDVKFCNKITFSISRSDFGSASTVSSAELHSEAKRQG